MNTVEKRKAALAALENHARRYKVTIPDRLKAFYAGDFTNYDLHHVNAEVLSWSNGTFQLALTPPTWLNKDDDAVNGPGGDWKGGKHHVPIFITDQNLYVVVNLQKPECPTGWYMEEECCEDGPQKGAKSLDAFLASLTKAPNTDDRDDIVRPAYPEQTEDWQEDFADDGPRAFDAVRDDDGEDD